jgi:hypothetical protein
MNCQASAAVEHELCLLQEAHTFRPTTMTEQALQDAKAASATYPPGCCVNDHIIGAECLCCALQALL